MKRHTKLAGWLLTFAGYAFAISPAVSWAQQAGNTRHGDSYSWKVEEQPQISTQSVPVVPPEGVMNLLDPPELNLPAADSPTMHQPPILNPSSLPPVVSPENAALPIQAAASDGSLAVAPIEPQQSRPVVPIVPASSVESMLQSADSQISGMPGQFASSWESADADISRAGHALYTNEVASSAPAPNVLMPQDISDMTMEQLLEGSVPLDAVPNSSDMINGLPVDSGVRAAAAQWPTHEGGLMQLQPEPPIRNFAPPIVQSTGGAPEPPAIRPINSGLPVIQSQPSLSDTYAAQTGNSAVYEGSGALTPNTNSVPVINQPYTAGPSSPMSMSSMSMTPMSMAPIQDQPVEVAPVEAGPADSGSMGQYDMGMGSVMDGSVVGDSYIQPPVGDAPMGDSSCTTCGNGPSIAGCPDCGVNGCYDQSAMASRFASCGSVAGAKNYFIFDTLYWDRGDMGRFGSTNAGTFPGSDWDVGWSFLLGRRHDYTSGDEIGYWGIEPLETRREITNVAPVFNALFVNGGFFGFPETGSFFNANQVIESRSTEVHSGEYNQVRWNWDVYKSFAGLRLINVRDEYNLFMSNGVNNGNLNIRTNNFLIGPQIGGELYPDIGYRGSLSLWTKAGVFANFSELSTHIDNFGNNILDNDDGSLDIACTLELGATAHYQISSRARFRLGYTLFWLNNLSGATNNFPGVISPGFGNNNIVEEEMFFHGLSGGIEIYR